MQVHQTGPLKVEADLILPEADKAPVTSAPHQVQLARQTLALPSDTDFRSLTPEQQTAFMEIVRERELTVRSIVEEAGGFFVGTLELAKLGKSLPIGSIPELPAAIDERFLMAEHPLHGGPVASHLVIGLDMASRKWVCFESNFVPRSFNRSFEHQCEMLQSEGEYRRLFGMELKPPSSSEAICQVLNDALRLPANLPVRKIFVNRDAKLRDFGRTEERYKCTTDSHWMIVVKDDGKAYRERAINSRMALAGLIASWEPRDRAHAARPRTLGQIAAEIAARNLGNAG